MSDIRTTSEDSTVLIKKKQLEFDDVLQGVGDFSKFQFVQWTLLVLFSMTQIWCTYAPAFEARKIREHQMYCENRPNITGKDMCSSEVWLNKTYCGDVKYNTDFTSIASDVSTF
jgi:hypothetical protein